MTGQFDCSECDDVLLVSTENSLNDNDNTQIVKHEIEYTIPGRTLLCTTNIISITLEGSRSSS